MIANRSIRQIQLCCNLRQAGPEERAGKYITLTRSQGIALCGDTSDANRPKKGLLFVCQNPKCRYTLHADLIGARHVTLRTLLVRQDWIRTGYFSMATDRLG